MPAMLLSPIFFLLIFGTLKERANTSVQFKLTINEGKFYSILSNMSSRWVPGII